MKSFSPISLLRKPCATSWTISFSRSESRGFSRRGPDSEDFEKAFMTSAVMRLSSQISPAKTRWMLLTSKSVADCFSTTPRAPRRIARTTSRSSSAAVRTITRVGSVSKLTSSRTARPSLSGMRRSRRRISGFSLEMSLMASAPFWASPTMEISSSESRSLRRPSRKIAWSSASRTRICCLVLAMSTEGDLYGQTSTMAGVRLDSQHTPDSARTLLYGNRTQPETVEFVTCETAREAEPFAVVVDNQDEPTVILRQFYHDMGSPRMLFYVVECFTVNLEQLAANAVRSAQFGGIDEQVQRESRLVAEALGEAPHEVHQVGGLHAYRTQVGDESAEIRSFIAHRLLKIGKAGGDLLGRGGNAAPEDIQLDFDAQERLQNPVVQIARNARALRFNGSSAQMPQEEEILESGRNVPGDAFEPGQVVLVEGTAAVLPAVEKEDASDGLAALFKCRGDQRADSEFLNGGAGEARNIFQRAAVAPVPAETGALCGKRIPAEGGIEIVEEQAVGARQGQILRNQALAFALLEPPKKDALEIRVAIGEHGFLDLERGGKLIEQKAKGFGKTLIHLERRRNTGEKFVFRGEAAAAVAEEREAGAAGESARGKADPRENAHPLNFAGVNGEKHHGKGERARKGKRGVEPPADAGREANEGVREPDGNGRRGDIHEENESEEVAKERQVPVAGPQKVLEGNGRQRQGHIGEKQRKAGPSFPSGGALEQGQNRKQNEERAAIENLPLEMETVALLKAHARGSVSRISVARGLYAALQPIAGVSSQQRRPRKPDASALCSAIASAAHACGSPSQSPAMPRSFVSPAKCRKLWSRCLWWE